jgi:SAM-dependent methyltransferase
VAAGEDSEPDFSDFLHELRGRELERLPADAEVVLSGGAAGAWYFDWFAERFPGEVRRHIAVEALQAPPASLPPGVEWIQSSLGDLSAVADGSVDLVFAGEVIEHLWPQDIASFLTEAHRVLRPGGTLTMDSPNRRVTEAIAWHHPEHTLEQSVDEAAELLELAGFDVAEMRGSILGYHAGRHRFLPIVPFELEGLSRDERVRLAHDRPEDAFVWWATARRAERDPDAGRLRDRVMELYARFRARRLARVSHQVGTVRRPRDRPAYVRAAPGEEGYAVFGPYLPVAPGSWEAVFTVRRPDPGRRLEGEVGGCDVAAGAEGTAIAGTLALGPAELPDAGWREFVLPFTLEQMATGVQFRVFATGREALDARLGAALRPSG